jgi:hypothetical protein
MGNIFIALFTFVLGYYIKYLFDTRDLRRTMLQNEFKEFEDTVIYIQSEWRNVCTRNLTDGRVDEFSHSFNDLNVRLMKSKHSIVFACKKIGEKKLIGLIDEGFAILNQAFFEYSVFIQNAQHNNQTFRSDAIDIVKTANTKFDNVFPIAMDKVYTRYWELISRTLILERVKSAVFNIFVRN